MYGNREVHRGNPWRGKRRIRGTRAAAEIPTIAKRSASIEEIERDSVYLTGFAEETHG